MAENSKDFKTSIGFNRNAVSQRKQKEFTEQKYIKRPLESVSSEDKPASEGE
jgi:hypothetical protein